ncbi:MAG: hypothetical protein AB7E79_14790 [Rhodospirillaceae bacterium]
MKSTAPRVWSVPELTAELRASVPLVEEILDTLGRRGIAARSGSDGYRYDCKDPRTDKIVYEIVRIYKETPVALIKEVIRAPNQKIHTFVDAFRLKKD